MSSTLKIDKKNAHCYNLLKYSAGGHFSGTLSGWDIQQRENIIMGIVNQVEQELMDYISGHKIINTHSHHLPEQMMTDFSLDKLLGNSYLQWQQTTPGTTAESRTAYLNFSHHLSDWIFSS